MLAYPEIHEDYASYASLRENNCVGYTILGSNDFNNFIAGVQNQKTQSLYRQVQPQEINQSIEEEEERYVTWKAIFDKYLDEQRKDALEHSVHRVFRRELWTSYFMALFGNFCHCLTAYLLYFLYLNVVHLTYQTTQNKILIAAIVLCRIIRVYCGYYGEILQNQVGVKMYRLVSNAVVKKTFKCSPLTNKKISATNLNKMVDTDCSILLMYPVKYAYFIENILCFVLLSALVVYVASWPGVIGISLVAANLFFRFLFKKAINKMDQDLAVLTKDRVSNTIEVFNIIKLIKANALECCYFNKLRGLRLAEVTLLKEKLYLEMVQNVVVMVSKPIIVVLVVKLIILFQYVLNVEILFTSNLAMIIINMQAILNAMAYTDLIQVANKNIQEFLQKEEMDLSHVEATTDSSSSVAIEISGGSFYWDANNENEENQGQNNKDIAENRQSNKLHEEKQAQPPSDQQQFYLKDIDLTIQRGELVTLIGAYGSGKTSLTNCILGEMRRSGKPKIKANGTIAYASQVAWIMNDTIRNNILFGKPYNNKRYAEAIKYASLETDLHLFANGDLQIIGKRGSTLSGGQKARVSLARALYADADIYILDDILSAVDAHVGAFLFSMTINKYLKEKTVLLITHSLYFVPHSDRVLLFDDGTIKFSGSYEQVKDSPALKKIEASKLRSTKDYDVIFKNKVEFAQPEDAKVKIAAAEDKRVFNTFDSFKIYVARNSGTRFAVIIVLFIVFLSIVTTMTQIILNSWAISLNNRSNFFLFLQLGLNALKVVITLSLAKVLMSSRLFQSTHDDMVKSLLFSPLGYFENTPSERIINRLSNDLNINDKIITTEFGFMLTNLQLYLSNLIGIFFVYFMFGSYFYMLFLIVVIAITIYFFMHYFTLSIRVNKMDSELIIPINSKYSELVDGLPTIRAYRKTVEVINNYWQKMNIYSLAALVRQIVDAKLKLILLGSMNFLACIQIISILLLNTSFGNYTVFLIFNFFGLEDCIIRFYVSLNSFAPRLQALAKCEELTHLEPEKGYEKFLEDNFVEDQPFEKTYFGTEIFPRGQISFENYSLRYKPDSEDVLKQLDMVIYPGQKIGIVGRTGSGKSTMMLGLLRILEASSGRIVIDGQDISKLSLEELRSNINIILQDHFMFTGTVKENVDPTGAHSDEEVQEALKLCGIWDVFSNQEGVNTQVTEGGSNLSAGEKQLLNITRSLLNPKRVVLIDEATASIDFQTDNLVQKVIKKQFANQTVLTIAHRINTVVNSDRILVLSKGEIQEFDKPEVLLNKQTSHFAKLYKESGKMKEDE